MYYITYRSYNKQDWANWRRHGHPLATLFGMCVPHDLDTL